MELSSKLIICILILLVAGIAFYLSKRKTNSSIHESKNEEEIKENPLTKNRVGRRTKIICRQENMLSEDYDRYILARGDKLKSVEDIISEYGKLTARVNPYTYRFSKAKLGDWTIIKIPSDFQNNYSYHNLIYWFLGYAESNNFTNEVIGLSIADDISYVLYGNYQINKALKLEEGLFGSFNIAEDEKFFIYVPSNQFTRMVESKAQTFHKLLESNNIDLKQIDSDAISYTEFEVLFNE